MLKGGLVMNIFILSQDPAECARFHCDTHVVKMPTESGIMLSTAHRYLDGHWKDGYLIHDKWNGLLMAPKGGYGKHMCSIWSRASLENYQWHYALFKELANEFTHRYGKAHGAWERLGAILATPPANIESRGWTPPAQAMPEHLRGDNPVAAYRKYYIEEKGAIARWEQGRTAPAWFTQPSESG